jgi:hypothetical protein
VCFTSIGFQTLTLPVNWPYLICIALINIFLVSSFITSKYFTVFLWETSTGYNKYDVTVPQSGSLDTAPCMLSFSWR